MLGLDAGMQAYAMLQDKETKEERVGPLEQYLLGKVTLRRRGCTATLLLVTKVS